MTKNWEHICVVLLSPTQNSSYSISISWLSNEANNINKDPNKINFITQNVQVNSNGLCEYASTFADVSHSVLKMFFFYSYITQKIENIRFRQLNSFI